MATIPEDIKEGIKKLSEATETPTATLIARLKEIIETDENIQTMEKEDFKIRFAWSVLYKEFASTGGTEDFYVTPLLHPEANERKSKKTGDLFWVGDMSALVQKLEKNEAGEKVPGEVQYAAGTFWREGAKNLKGLEVGKVYKVALIAKENSWGLDITTDRSPFIKVDYKFPVTFEQFYNEEIVPKNIDIGLGEMDLNTSETTTDIRVVTVTAFDGDVAERDDGTTYGWYDFMDDSIMGSNNRMFFSDKDVIWSQGSILKVGIHIEMDEKGVVRTTPHFIVPTGVAEKRTFNVKPVKQDEVDVSLDEPEKTVETITKDDIATVKAEDLAPTEAKPEAKPEPKVKKDEFEI